MAEICKTTHMVHLNLQILSYTKFAFWLSWMTLGCNTNCFVLLRMKKAGTPKGFMTKKKSSETYIFLMYVSVKVASNNLQGVCLGQESFQDSYTIIVVWQSLIRQIYPSMIFSFYFQTYQLLWKDFSCIDIYFSIKMKWIFKYKEFLTGYETIKMLYLRFKMTYIHKQTTP